MVNGEWLIQSQGGPRRLLVLFCSGPALPCKLQPWVSSSIDSSWSFEIMRLDLFDWIGHRPQFLLLCLFLAFPLPNLSLWSQGHKK